VKTKQQDSPDAILPTSAPVFIPGRDISSIEIKTPAAIVNNPGSPPSKEIDLTVNKKMGEGVTSSQQEFIIQKAMQTITIAADGKKTGALSISKNDIAARISMAIQIDPLTNTLTVDTPQGRRRVSIMPDDAVSIMRELRLLEKNAIPNDILLESHNNQLTYRIQSTKIQKLLGLIPITVPKEIFIAADTGGVVGIQLSPLYNFLTLFTF